MNRPRERSGAFKALLWLGTAWATSLWLMLAYEIATALFMFGAGGPISPQPWVGIADLLRMMGGLSVAFGFAIVLPVAVARTVWSYVKRDTWTWNDAALAALVPVMALAWFGVPVVIRKYEHRQLHLILENAKRVSQHYSSSGSVRPQHGGLRGSGFFLESKKGAVRLTLPSHLCSYAYVEWTASAAGDTRLQHCLWQEDGWAYHCE
jgi:hypothetical protein